MTSFRILCLGLTAALFSTAGFTQTKAAAATTGDAALRATLLKAYPGITIESIKPSPIPGFREVASGGRVVYVSNDGKYLFQGALVTLPDKDNLTRRSEGAIRKSALDTVAANRYITFAPAKPKHRVTVFTDIDCGFCRKLHEQMAEYNKRGIAVDYLFFPRAGAGSQAFKDAISVSCAKDPRKAMTDAKAGRPIKALTCKNTVAADFDLGRRVGVDGTPAIYSSQGVQIGGYLSPDDLLKELDKQAAAGKNVASAAR